MFKQLAITLLWSFNVFSAIGFSSIKQVNDFYTCGLWYGNSSATDISLSQLFNQSIPILKLNSGLEYGDILYQDNLLNRFTFYAKPTFGLLKTLNAGLGENVVSFPTRIEFLDVGSLKFFRTGFIMQYATRTGQYKAFMGKRYGVVVDISKSKVALCINKSHKEKNLSDKKLKDEVNQFLLEIQKLADKERIDLSFTSSEELGIFSHNSFSHMRSENIKEYLASHWDLLSHDEKAIVIAGALSSAAYSGQALSAAKMALGKIRKVLMNKIAQETGKTFLKNIVKRMSLALIGAGGLVSASAMAITIPSSSAYANPYEYFFTTYGTEKLIYWDEGNYNYALQNNPQLEDFLRHLAQEVESFETHQN